MPEATKDADDLFSLLELDDTPFDANDRFWEELTTGSYKKISNIRYWLITEMSRFEHLKERNVKITKNKVTNGAHQDAPLSRIEWAKISLEYYLMCYHLPRFDKEIHKSNTLGVCDMAVMIDRIAAYEDVREVIEGKEKNPIRGKNIEHRC